MDQIARSAKVRAVLMRTRTRANNLELRVETHKEGVACGSVSGPPNLKSVATIHREVPTIPLDPPGNGPDVTQIKKFRQHKSKNFYKAGFDGNLGNGKNYVHASMRSPMTQTKDMQELACACKDLW
jgi:hypothetical protein